MSQGARWEHFHHKADMGVRGFGPSLEEAFCQAALALTAVSVDPAAVRPEEAVGVAVAAPDPELLLADWLSALVTESDTRRMLFSRFELSITDGDNGLALAATAWGEPLDSVRHDPGVEVKAVTYAELKVARTDDGGWYAQCVVDV
jgi:tRNA nucleotidyltransferase (CCA-adding enzyme)